MKDSPQSSSVEPNMDQPPLTFGISCLHYKWETLDQAFARVQNEFPVGSIEFSTTRLEEPDYEPCRRLSLDTGIGVDLHAWDNLAAHPAADGITAMRQNLDICTKMGAAHLVVHLGANPSREQGIATVTEICQAVAPLYEEAGVTICLENHYLFDYGGKNEIGGEPADFLPIFSAVESPAVRFCHDYGHSHMSKNTTAFIDELAPYLVYTHIADNLGEHDDHLAFEEGTVDWEKEIAHTLSVGLRGPFVIEFPEWRCGIERFAEFMDLVRSCSSP